MVVLRRRSQTQTRRGGLISTSCNRHTIQRYSAMNQDFERYDEIVLRMTDFRLAPPGRTVRITRGLGDSLSTAGSLLPRKGIAVTNRISWHVTAFVTALMLFPTGSGAQTPATSFDGLRGLLQLGNDVVVTDSNGRRTRGRVVIVTASSLDLAVDTRRFLFLRQRTQQSFADTVVTMVTRVDSRKEGAIIGFAAGFVPIMLAPCDSRDDGGYCFFAKVTFGPMFGALGAAIGAFIDGRLNKTVYRAGAPVAPVTITLSPLLSTKTTGASLSLRF